MNDRLFFQMIARKGYQLTEAQRAVVEHDGGPLIVFAGPGSGKTTTITLRAFYLWQVRGVLPAQMTVITFTRKAARELSVRLRRLHSDLSGIRAGTFHSVFLHHYMAYTGESPRIATDFEARRLWGQAALVRGVPVGQSYAALKSERGLWDYDDILLQFRRLLEERPDVAAAMIQSSPHWLVDEFQDTNEVQWAVIRTIAQGTRELVAVGDDDQSIYGFRGALPEIMLQFTSELADAKEVLLGANFRSTEAVIRSSSRLIGWNTLRRDKGFQGRRGEGVAPTITAFKTEVQEAAAVARWMVQRSSRAGPAWSGAVLARTNAQLAPLRESLDNLTRGNPLYGVRISILTLHAAKGLEFDDVMIIGLREGSCPHPQALAEALTADELALAVAEERRLVYVGMTRARVRLDLTYSRRAGREACKPSRFLEEITGRGSPNAHKDTPQAVLDRRPPAIGTRCVHRQLGLGEVRSVESLRTELHKVGILCTGQVLRYVYWPAGLDSGLIQAYEDREAR